ncbi:MAG TPA: fumarate hydratase, partial [Candidatus Bathyarchaeota archaeon]|nr:fumarate hydratase [Candidatus Bathyarchaeota archaeon]
KAVSRATLEVPLRPNAVDPISRENTGDNTGRLVPWLDLELVEGDSLELTVVPKGFGSEMMARLRCVPAAEGFEAVKRFIISSVLEAGGKPCPPIVLGVGMGGVAETAMRLAKRAIARPVGERHPEERISELEEELLEAINETGIGAMGLGGRTTALDVHVEYAHTHTVGTPVALVFQCWCARRASAIIEPDGSAVCTSHPGVDLWRFT